jgi:hypothetical protein
LVVVVAALLPEILLVVELKVKAILAVLDYLALALTTTVAAAVVVQKVLVLQRLQAVRVVAVMVVDTKVDQQLPEPMVQPI